MFAYIVHKVYFSEVAETSTRWRCWNLSCLCIRFNIWQNFFLGKTDKNSMETTQLWQNKRRKGKRVWKKEREGDMVPTPRLEPVWGCGGCGAVLSFLENCFSSLLTCSAVVAGMLSAHRLHCCSASFLLFFTFSFGWMQARMSKGISVHTGGERQCPHEKAKARLFFPLPCSQKNKQASK